jgi:N4-bis(aminopropyl)spermidine synthase
VSAGSLDQALAELRSAWGIHSRRPFAAVSLLAGDEPVPVARLVAESGLSHRSVTDVLRHLQPWLESTPAGHRLTALPVAPAVSLPPGGGGPGWGADGTERWPGRRPEWGGLEQRLAALKAAAPPRRRHLDHVEATAETCIRRAAFLAERYDLDGAHVLCLGDHDLTSLALAVVAPGASIAVVDVDDDLLRHVARSACELGSSVACRFADLRLGLPPSLRGWADLVFTDPPYTPDGVRLFALRGCEALRRDDRSRLLLCYGYGERQPALGLKVQAALHSLRLLVEEVRPGFNRYVGAQAIGSASALYVTRPLKVTWRAVERESRTDARIYTHGPMAVEAGERALPAAVARELPDPIPVADLWRLSERHAAARPERRPSLPDTAAVDLSLEPALAVRLLLVNRGRRLRIGLPAASAAELLAPGRWQARFLGAAYRLREVARDGGVAVVEAERREDPVEGAELLARHLVRHPAAALASTLPQALVAAGAARTQREARALAGDLGEVDARPAELPIDALRDAAESLPALLAAGGAGSQPV